MFSDDQIRNKDIDTLKRFLRLKLGGYVVAIKDITAGNMFYRGVRWSQRPQNVSELSYPPANIVTKLTRVAREHVEIFYASSAPPSVFFEIRAKPGDRVALSQWRAREPLWMHNLGYHPGALHRMGVRELGARSVFANPIPNETKANERLRRRMSLAFTEDVMPGMEYRYNQSIAINELLFDKAGPLPTFSDGSRYDKAAGTVYPAIQMRGGSDNIAMLPAFVASSLVLRSASYVLVEDIDYARSSCTFLTSATAETFVDGIIGWKECVGTEAERRTRITFQNERWAVHGGTRYVPGIGL